MSSRSFCSCWWFRTYFFIFVSLLPRAERVTSDRMFNWAVLIKPELGACSLSASPLNVQKHILVFCLQLYSVVSLIIWLSYSFRFKNGLRTKTEQPDSQDFTRQRECLLVRCPEILVSFFTVSYKGHLIMYSSNLVEQHWSWNRSFCCCGYINVIYDAVTLLPDYFCVLWAGEKTVWEQEKFSSTYKYGLMENIFCFFFGFEFWKWWHLFSSVNLTFGLWNTLQLWETFGSQEPETKKCQINT